MDKDDDPNANQANELPPKSQNWNLLKRRTPLKRESRKWNASDLIQSKSKVADDKETPPPLANSAPKGVEGTPPAVDLAKSTSWVDTPAKKDESERNKTTDPQPSTSWANTSALAEELGWIITDGECVSTLMTNYDQQ